MLTALRRLGARVRAYFSPAVLERDLDQELESHVAMLTEENIRKGMSPAEARRGALVRMGARESMREAHREIRGLPFLDTLMQDLRYTFRTLRRDAAFAAFAILIVGLGIGASCTIFSVVNTLLLRPLPFGDPSSLVWLANQPRSVSSNDLSGQTVQVGYLLDLRASTRSFSDLGAYFAFYGIGDANLFGQGEPERFTLVPVTQNFFPVLGVQPLLGRNFTADEARDGGPNAVMISYSMWENRFASDPSIIGRAINIGGNLNTVVGVLPASFDFGGVFAPGTHVDLYSPFPLNDRTNREGNTLAIVGRLKPGVNLASAQAETTTLAGPMRQEHPERNGFTPGLTALAQHVSGRVRPALILLACAVGVVMLIVCANLSNLLLARGASRQKEIAIRSALGASKPRLVRQMLTEALVLSCAGGALGLLFAFAGTDALSHLSGVTIPLLEDVHVDAASLIFTLLAAIATGVFFGLAPALHVPGEKLHESLKDAHRGSSQGRSHTWVRNVLVVSEVALTCVLVIGAGLLIHSFLRVLDVNMGFHPERAVALRVDPARSYSTQDQRNAYFSETLHRALGIPGVEAAGLSDSLPFGHNRTWWAGATGRTYVPPELPLAFVRVVSEGYIGAMGIPLIEGRDFSESDTPTSQKVIIINQTLAKRNWPNQDPIGQQINQAGGRTVIGVVGDVRHLALEEDSGSEMYIPIRQGNDYGSVDLVVRSSLSTAELNSRLRETLRPIAPNLTMSTMRTLQSIVDKSVSPRRFVVLLLAGFAAFALILASLGIYAVISYSVSQRTQEIGIRMALGASTSGVRASILFETLRLAAMGMAIGILASWTLAGALRSLLFGVGFADPVTFVGMLVILTLVAALAGYLPARRASRIDPMVALRAQ
ncbi:MAG TPA: ABC transporter permease [Candidatus Acidoferrum sp.]|jgi:predicted permease|nr:ABC transporter permease [Candidatus Acidoferrum sp.]